MTLAEILADPVIMAEVRSRACGGASIQMGPPVALPPVAARWPVMQNRVTGPATNARMQSTQGVGEKGVR